MTEATRPITISEDRLRAVMAEFKNELFEKIDEKADKDSHDLLDHRVRVLELWQAGIVATETTKRDFSTRSLILVGLAVTLFVGLLTAAATLVSHLVS